MIRHLLKLVWNRKRANALIVAEIFVSFLVIFAVLTGSITFAQNWRRPLGFDWHEVWDVSVDVEREGGAANDVHLHESMMRMIGEARAFPQVEAAAGDSTPPYAFSTMSTGTEVHGRRVELIFDEVSDDYAKVMRMKVVRGRWFSREDDAAQVQPAVIDTNAAQALFPDADPIGKLIDDTSDSPVKVVGVVEGYRKDGETSSPACMIFRRVAPDHRFGGLLRNIVLRVRPGTPADFEQTLVARLQAVAPDLSLRVRHMDQMRTENLRLRLAPLVAGAIIGAFLISMVALGLTGVLWQNVTRRTREIGVRRALGATGPHVHRQILLEVALLATIALAVGSVVVLQLPVLGAFSIVTPDAFAAGFAGALATIYALTVLCGLYPSWLASRLAPADALRYE